MQAKPFEEAPYADIPDETEVNLRAHFDSLSDEKLQTINLSWGDEQLQDWDGNFRSDGVLMMVCCDRDVEMDEYRKVLSEFLKYRDASQ